MDSNITLRSNVYINQSAQRDDKRFLQHITDYRVLKKYKDSSYGFQNNMSWMTSVQMEILRQGQPNCSLEKGTMSWGVPVGGDCMVCRCEQYDCPRFSICSKYSNYSPVSRKKEEEISTKPDMITPLGLYTETPEEKPKEEEILESEGQNEPNKIEKSVVDSTSTEQIQEESVNAEINQEINNKTATDRSAEPKMHTQVESAERKVVSQEVIINADVHKRIWVNAGPGTGKTYTVIQRLKKLLDEGNEGTILVLCFSRNAVQVIRERLTEELGHIASTLIDDGQLVIRTFDSFATYMLEDELNPAWDYNQRIEAFIKMIRKNSGTLNEMLGYLIVDEIQDTVGVRARMLLSILDELKCGALLLGDSCQAIFDWTIRASDDMTFGTLASELEKRQFVKYELSENKRQTAELAEVGLQLRDKILHATEDDQEAAIIHFKKWAGSKWSTFSLKALPKQLSGNSDLVLCKTNGEAAHISQILFESSTSVEHVMKQSSSHRSLAAWIAKVLRGNDGLYLSKESFMSNAAQSEICDAEEKWNTLKSLDGHPHAAVLHIKEVLAALSKMESLSNVCLNQHHDGAIISTVHRAKGSEAEHVYWLDSPLVYGDQQDQEGALGDSIKAAYVAATRAKKDIHILSQEKNFYMRSVNDTRWIQTGISKNKKLFCKGIAFLPEDVDPASFVSIGTADEVQAILSCLEPGMPVTLWPNEDCNRFDIFFDGQPIGYTSEEFITALFAAFEATNHNKNWPSSIQDVYITAITTVVMPERIDVDTQYRTAGCWIGIELGGFPTIEWY